MAQSLYSFMGSRLHLILEDRLAEGYNGAIQAFLDAQTEYRKAHGLKELRPDDLKHVRVPFTKEQLACYNNICNLIDYMIKINGGSLDIRDDETNSDFLILIERFERNGGIVANIRFK